MDNVADFRNTLAKIGDKQITVAHDNTTECLYICLSDNYNEATKIMTNATEICKVSNTSVFSHLLKSLEMNNLAQIRLSA